MESVRPTGRPIKLRVRSWKNNIRPDKDARKMLWTFRSFFTGRSPAYSGLQRVGRQQAQCSCPWERGGELVGVCSVCTTCRRGKLSRHEQLVLANVLRQDVAYCLTSLATPCQCIDTTRMAIDCATTLPLTVFI